MADEDLGAGFVTITLEDQRALDAADKLADNIAQRLDRGARIAGARIERAITRSIRRVSPISVEIDADMDRFLTEVALLVRNPPTVQVPVMPKVNAAQWRRMIIEATSGIEIPIRVVPEFRGFDAAIRTHNTPTIRPDVDPKFDATKLTKALSGVGAVASKAVGPLLSLTRLSAVAISAASAAQSIGGLIGALAPAAGALAALPAVIGGVVAANLTLKLALSGVGDAFGAALTGDSKEFQKALDGLGPAARTAALEVRTLKPVFENLRNAVQGEFFGPLEGQIEATGKALAGPLTEGMSGIAQEFGRAAAQVLEFVRSTEAVSNIGKVFTGTQLALSGLGQAAQNVLQGVLAIAGSVSEAFGDQLGSGIQTVAERLGTFLTQAAESGNAVAWVDNALTVFAQLGDIIGNVGHILGDVFGAAQQSGGGFLNNLRELTDQVREFTSSAEGTKALQNVFQAISSIAANMGPIIGSVVQAVGEIAPALVPVVNTIGPAIRVAIDAIAPALKALTPAIQTVAGALSDAIEQIANSGALEALATALASVAKAIAPILPVAAQLVATLGQALTPIVAALAPVLGAVTSALGVLVTALSPLLVVAGQLIAQLGPVLTPIVTALGQVIAALAPIVQTVADILSAVLGPILAQLPALLQPFLDAVNQLVAALLPPLNQLLIALQPSLAQLTDAFVQVLVALTPVITQLAVLAVGIVNQLTPFLPPLIQLIAELANIFSGTLARYLTSIVIPALNAVAALLKGDFSGAFRAMKEVVKGEIQFVVDLFLDLPNKLLSAVLKFGSLLDSAGRDLVQGMINGVKSMIGNLLNTVGDMASAAVDKVKSILHIGSPSKVFHQIGEWTGEGFANGIIDSVDTVGRAATKMVGASMVPVAPVVPPGAAALSPFTQPFGTGSMPGTVRTTSGRQAAVQTASGGTTTIVNNWTINEVGDAETTAQRVLNRLALESGLTL